MSTAAASPDTVGAGAVMDVDVDEGADVDLAHTNYDYASPVDVDDVQEVRWRVPFGEDFRTLRVELAGSYGADYRVDVVQGAEEIPVVGSSGRQGYLTQFDIVDDAPAPRTIDEDLEAAVVPHDPPASIDEPPAPEWTPDVDSAGEVVRPDMWSDPATDQLKPGEEGHD